MKIPVPTALFLERYWQKQPLFLPRALADVWPALDADELAWLALQPDVEARLVITRRAGAAVTYELRQGPFRAASFESLPRTDWTLLVNDVDKHLPDFRTYFGNVDFLPDWRIDDLMVSAAAPGGSVGPHVDNYDVFLVQGKGRRRWAVGSAGRTEPADDRAGLSLVRPFEPDATWEAVEGDVLYLPPGIPHWGVAMDDCVTYSIGMRAPTMQELVSGYDRVTGAETAPGTADPVFYADPDLAPDEAAAGCIHARAVARIREQRLLEPAADDVTIATALGCVVTDPKAWLMAEPPGKERIDALLAAPCHLEVHGMARIAWHEAGDLLVFVNGDAFAADPALLPFVRAICEHRALAAAEFAALLSTRGGAALVRWQLREGLFDADRSDEREPFPAGTVAKT